MDCNAMEQAASMAKDLVKRQTRFEREHHNNVPSGYYNALRHSLRMAIAVELGVSPYQATRYGIAHEEDGRDNNAKYRSRDSNIDLNNNQVGAAVGMNVVKRDGEIKPLSHDKTPLQDAYNEIVDLIRTNGRNAGGCIDVTSGLG